MSVTTTADEHVRAARENLNDAYKNLLVALNEDTWGHNEYSVEYMEKLFDVARELLQLKKKI